MRSEYDLEERFVPGSLRGYRTWHISSEIKLTAINNAFLSWQRGRNEATCTRGDYSLMGESTLSHSKFNPQCSCGFYARYKPDDILDTFNWSNITHIVAGAIKGTGRVAQGTRGYRAEFVQVEAICPIMTIDFPFGNSGTMYQVVVKSLAVAYGVPWYPTMEALIEDFPPEENPLSPELLAKAKEAEKRAELMKKAAAGMMVNALQNVVIHIPGQPPAAGAITIPPNSLTLGSPLTINATSTIPSFFINKNGA